MSWNKYQKTSQYDYILSDIYKRLLDRENVMSTDNKDKKYNDTICRLYEMANGYWGLAKDSSENYENFMKFVDQGGIPVIKINKRRKDDKSPHAYLEWISADKVKEMQANKRKAANEDI